MKQERLTEQEILESPGFILLGNSDPVELRGSTIVEGFSTSYTAITRLAAEVGKKYMGPCPVPQAVSDWEETTAYTVKMPGSDTEWFVPPKLLAQRESGDSRRDAELRAQIRRDSLSDEEKINALLAAHDGGLSPEALLALGWVPEFHGKILAERDSTRGES